jgi:acetyl esterase/lipase
MGTNSPRGELTEGAAAQGRSAQRHSYGRHPDQVADLLMPDRDGPHPVAVLLHGGFWRSPFTRSLMGGLAVGLAERNWASWNVEYRRGPGAGSTSLRDVQAAVAKLRKLRAPLELCRLVIIGHSAGGHLALCCAPTAGASLVISLAGVSDLVAAVDDRLGDGAAREFMGAMPNDAPAAYRDLNPMAMLPSGARTLLVHGDQDDRVPISQSRAYLAAAQAAGDQCALLELPGEGHFNLIDPRTPAFRAYATRLP